MRLKARAKINWTLDITGQREDGYHLMDMLMQPVTLHDIVTIEPAEAVTLTTSGQPLLPPDESHLALRAARAVFRLCFALLRHRSSVKPKLRSIRSSLRQSSFTFTQHCRFTRHCRKSSSSCRAAEAIFLSIAPPLPMMIPLWLFRSQ